MLLSLVEITIEGGNVQQELEAGLTPVGRTVLDSLREFFRFWPAAPG
ncbi:MAG: hypothetical protein MK161_11185 [Pirellulales bacterium]|nr:hypothetical protein [Pirellulales bacterium]